MTSGRPIRVLVVDDSVAVRRIVAEALASDPGLQVVGAASNGADALALVGPLKPDVVLLDLEMPVMDGLEMLRQLKAAHPRVKVVVFSAYGPNAVERTLQALWLGACDYVPKPAAARVQDAILQVRDELVWRIKAFASPDGPRPHPRARNPVRHVPPPVRRPEPRATLVTIGASTGGPRALADLLGEIPGDFAAPIVIVQHLPASFTAQLATGLSRRSRLPVRVAEHGRPVGPGEVWIAPGTHHLLLERHGIQVRLALADAPPENACRPSVDPLFRSAAATLGSRVLGVVLTGMGRDGLDGCRAIRRAGGDVVAQDEATSVVWGMPGSVVREGLAGEVLPLAGIPASIVRRVHRAGERGEAA